MLSMKAGVWGSSFCVHRWSIVKKWSSNSKFYSIERCRWCDQWKRREVGMDIVNGQITDNMMVKRLNNKDAL